MDIKTMINRVKWILAILLGIGFGMGVAAQDGSNKELQVILRGRVSCLKPERGLLADVAVFNLNKDWGTMTDVSGAFSLPMGKNDTIIFSTALHQDYIYYFKSDTKFEDHSIDIMMEPDVIWLETVTIIGNQSLEEFKNEIMQLEALADDEVNIATPVISRYAKQLVSGDGEFVLLGPLSYLSHKFGRYKNTRRKIEDKKNQDK